MIKIQEILYLLYCEMVNIWNEKIVDSVDMLTMKFSSSTVSSLAVLMERLSNHVFLPIAGFLATVFLIVRFCSLALDSRGQLDVWGIAKLFIRCFICMAIVQNTVSIIRELVVASTKIIDNVIYWASAYTGGTSLATTLQFRGSSLIYDSSTTIINVTDLLTYTLSIYLNSTPFDSLGSLWSFVLIICMIIFVIATAILSWAIYIMVFWRIFKIILYGTFASVSVATCIGGPEISRTGITYIKYMIGLIFSNVVIYVALIFAGLVRDNIIPISASAALSATTSNALALAILTVCVEMLAYMAFCCITVAGVDRVMQRTFAL